MAWQKVTGFPLHHWNQSNFNKLIAKFSYLIDVNKDTAKKANIAIVKLHVSCEDVGCIPSEFNIMIRNQLRQIKIKIVARMRVPNNPTGVSTDQTNLLPTLQCRNLWPLQRKRATHPSKKRVCTCTFLKEPPSRTWSLEHGEV